jgi:hypothetical protein
MAGRQVFYLTNGNLVALVIQGSSVTERQVFPASRPGQEAFERHVRARRDFPARLIVDLAEEDLRFDTIPHLRGKDREAVIARRLGQLFRTTPFRYAQVQGREAEGRRDDRIIFAAVTNPEILTPWIEALERANVALDGVHSASVLSPAMLTALKLTAPNVLLVTFTPAGTLRQTFLRNGELRFSRLTPVDRAEKDDTLGGLIAAETAHTWQYLDSTRAIPAGERLDVCVLIHPGERRAVEPALRAFEQLRYTVVGLDEAARKLGLQSAPASGSAEEVFAAVVGRGGVENHFAQPESQRYAVLRQARFAINGLAILALAIGVGYGGVNLAKGFEDRDRDAANVARIAALSAERNEIVKSFPPLEVPGDVMRETVDLYNRSLRDYPHPETFLAPISAVLSRHAGVRLTQIAWRTGDDPNAVPVFQPSAGSETPAIRSTSPALPARGATAPAPPQGSAAPLPAGKHAVAILEGAVPLEGLAYREALALIERVVADLGALPGYRATLVEGPLDVASSAKLEGRLSEQPVGRSLARFTVRVIRERGRQP